MKHTMLELIALLAPALMALGVYNHLHRGKLAVRNLVFTYGVFAVFINLCAFLVTLYLFGNDTVSFVGKPFVKYIILASLLALALPFVVNLIEHTVAIEVKKNVKK